MSTNCLVTKFKGEVSNNNLPILGYARLLAKAAATLNFQIKGEASTLGPRLDAINPPTEIKRADGIIDTLPIQRNYNTAGTQMYTVTMESGQDIMLQKYYENLTGILLSTDTRDAVYFDDSSFLYYIRNISLVSIQHIGNCTVNINNLDFSDECNNISFNYYTDKCDVTGNIEELDNLLSLERLWLPGTACTGNVETLADKMVANGRDSGTLQVSSNMPHGSLIISSSHVKVTFCPKTENPRGWYDTYAQS